MNKPRIKYLFKINGEVVVEENRDLFLNQVDEMKWIIVHECECDYDLIDVERVEMQGDYSDFDITPQGLVNWKDPQFKVITGVKCDVTEDFLLDRIIDKIAETVLILN